MLNEAIMLAGVGRAVYVVAADGAHARQLENSCRRLWALAKGLQYYEPTEDFEKLGIKFEDEESLGCVHWTTMTLHGAHPNCVLLFDHHTIEKKFESLVRELRRYEL